MIGYILIFIGTVFTLLDTKLLLSKINSFSIKLKSIFKIALIFAIGAVSTCNESEQKQQKKDFESNLKKRDSVREIDYINNLKKYNKENSDSLKAYSSNIINLLGKYSLKYDIATNKISKAIDSAKSKNGEPYITSPFSNISPVSFRQSHDTLHINPIISNAGESAATNVNIKIYFIVLRNNITMAIKSPIATEGNSSISKKESVIIMAYIYNYVFNEKNDIPIILILGSFENNEGKEIPIKIAYGYNILTHNFGICEYPQTVERSFKNATPLYLPHGNF